MHDGPPPYGFAMTSSLRRRLGTVLALIALASGVTLVAGPASPALAACSGSSCNGKDPNAQGCSGVNVSGTEVWQASFSVAMRYSSGCAARWTRLVIDDYLPTCCVPITISTERQIWSPYGYARTHWYSKQVGAGVEGSFWTVMTQNSSDDRHNACWRLGTGTWHCSPWIY